MNSRRAPFSTLASRLAFQVDRKILQLEEEPYVRLDLSAHEAALLRLQDRSKTAMFGSMKRFVLASLVIYFFLFSLTNAPAYVKILQASIQSADLAEEASLEPLNLTVLNTDPWTGETVGRVRTPEETLAILPVADDDDSLLALNLTPTTYDNRLRIPSLEVNAPVVMPTLGLDALKAGDWNALESQIRDSLLAGVVHYPGTAEPGKIGNAFYTGHSSNVLWQPSQYNTVFALLPKIAVGDDIYVTHEQKEFHYRVVSKKEVSPSDVSILKQGDQKILTLMTCTPVGTTLKRLVVTAELVSD